MSANDVNNMGSAISTARRPMAVPPKFPVLVRWKSLRRISTRPSTGLSTAIHIRWPSGTTIRKWNSI